MTVFRRVAELQSFSAAARELGLSNAAVSKHVNALEERLGARLLQRTTRRVSLTASGAAYLERCARILDDVDELDQSVAQAATHVKGTLRVNVPSAFGQLYISPLIAPLLARWPELQVELSLSDRFIDLAAEGVDVVLRIAAELPDSATLVAQKLAHCTQLTCATPQYLKTHGTPATPADLARHACLVYTPRTQWVYRDGDRTIRVPVRGALRADSSLAVRDALVAHAGIAQLPAFYVDALVRAKRLRAVLTAYEAPPIWIHAVYPRQRHLSTKAGSSSIT